MKSTRIHTLFIIFCLVTSTSIIAQKIPYKKKVNKGPSWLIIGDTKVSGGGVDHDVIKLSGPRDDFRKLKFKVTNSGLHMNRMEVVFDNNSRQKINIKQNIDKGGESRVIDLNGGKRSIRSIKFWYEDKGFLNGRAKVTVFGKR